jgi:hypothetical protein
VILVIPAYAGIQQASKYAEYGFPLPIKALKGDDLARE